MATSRPRPGPSLRVALAVIGIGVLLAVPSGAIAAVRIFKTIDARTIDTPDVFTRHLAAGTWVIFERTGTATGGSGFTVGQNGAPDLDPSEVTVVGPDGDQVAVEFVTTDETISKNLEVFTGVLQFHAPSGGQYRIDFNTPAPREVLVTRSLGGTFRSVVAELVTGTLGGVLVLTGLVLLIVGVVRRSRVPQPGMAPVGAMAATPPGWYPDPQWPGRQRWWDGYRWTEHQA